MTLLTSRPHANFRFLLCFNGEKRIFNILFHRICSKLRYRILSPFPSFSLFPFSLLPDSSSWLINSREISRDFARFARIRENSRVRRVRLDLRKKKKTTRHLSTVARSARRVKLRESRRRMARTARLHLAASSNAKYARRFALPCVWLLRAFPRRNIIPGVYREMSVSSVSSRNASVVIRSRASDITTCEAHGETATVPATKGPPLPHLPGPSSSRCPAN